MQEMTMQEVDAVNGGLSVDAGGVAITMLGVVATVASAPLLGGFAVGLGIGMLITIAFAK